MLGLYNILSDDGYNHLVYNTDEVFKSGSSIIHNYGIRTDGSVLMNDNTCVAEGVGRGDLRGHSSQIMFDNVRLLESPEDRYISKDDYVTLLSGTTVPGRKVFSPKLHYSVHDVVLEDNIETSATFTKEECPVLMVKYFNARVTKGGYITIPYFVDTYNMDSVRYDRLDNTFTVIALDKNGNELYKRTHYAGDGEAVIGPFNTLGKDWIELKAIDSDGCASPSIFCDYFVDKPTEPVLLNVDMPLLAQFHILEGEEAFDESDTTDAHGHPIIEHEERLERTAFRNKLGFSALFSYAKSLGYDGVRMPTVEENGVTRPAVFNISYNINEYTGNNKATSSNIIGKLDLSTIKYFRVKVAETDTPGIYEYTEVHQILWNDFYQSCMQYLWTNWSEDKYLISANNGTRTYHPFYVVSNISSTSAIEASLVAENKLKRPQKTSIWPAVGDIVADHSVYDAPDEQFDATSIGSDGYHYIMLVRSVTNRETNSMQWSSDQNIVFPDDFVLDLNGATINGYDTTCMATNTRLFGLLFNNNVRIINGKMVGSYKTFRENNVKYCVNRFSAPINIYERDGSLYRLGDVGAGCNTIEVRCSFNCTIKNLDISYGMGYDGTMSGEESAKRKLGMISYSESNINEALDSLRNSFSGSSISPSIYNDFPYDSFYGLNTRTMSISKKLTFSSSSYRMGVIKTFGGDGAGDEVYNYGPRQHYIVLCYSSSGKLIKMFKVFRGSHVKFNNSIASIQFIVYGRSGAFTSGFPDTGGTFPVAPTLETMAPCSNVVFSDCIMNNSKSNVCHTEFALGCGHINVSYHRTGLGMDEFPWATAQSLFTDFEEGGESIERAFFVNCHHEGKIVDENGVDGSNVIIFHGGNQFYMDRTTGLDLRAMNRVRCIIIENSHLDKYQIGFSKDSPIGFLIIRNCIIDDHHSYTDRKTINYGSQSIVRGNGSVIPPANKIAAITDTVMNKVFLYNNFHFHRVRNGKQIFD